MPRDFRRGLLGQSMYQERIRRGVGGGAMDWECRTHAAVFIGGGACEFRGGAQLSAGKGSREAIAPADERSDAIRDSRRLSRGVTKVGGGSSVVAGSRATV